MPDTPDLKTAASAQGEGGEGNYKAARDFQSAQHEFARDKQKVRTAAEDAADALDGPDGAALERAERETAAKGNI